jgi:hypothetical protein
VGGHHTDGAPGLDFLDKLSQAAGNAQAPDRESMRHARLWKATIMLLSRYKVAYGKKRKIMRNVGSVAERKESYFAEIDKSWLTRSTQKRRAGTNSSGDATRWFGSHAKTPICGRSIFSFTPL